MTRRRSMTVLLWALTPIVHGQSAPKRVLYLTHSAGFRHSSIEVSKQVVESLANQTGALTVTVSEDLSFLSANQLRQFDAVLFFTSGELALTNQQKSDLLAFVQAGGGFGGVHSATDTLYSWPEYGQLIGGVFDGHPWVQEASIDVEDNSHPISSGLAPSWRLVEEYYQFREFSRNRVRVLMTLDTRSVNLNADGVNRSDKDFALAWVHSVGAGRVFYTALGHFDETWRDPRFQSVIKNGLLWMTGLAPGSASIALRDPSNVALPGAVAPGAALEIYGTGLTTGSSIVADAMDWKYRLAGTRVLVNGEEAPLYYASPTQLNVQFPTELRSSNIAQVSLVVGEKEFNIGSTPVVPAVPVIRGVRRVANALEIYATGLGSLAENIATGQPAPIDRLLATNLKPTVRIDGIQVPVSFSGLAPGWIALYQVNAELPVGSAPHEVELQIGGRTATRVLTSLDGSSP